MKITYFLRQIAKMGMQHIYLPALYWIYKGKKIRKGSVIFADAHHNELPFSMKCMYDEIKKG